MNLAAGNATKIVQAIYKEVQVQTLAQVDRRSVYNIISNFLQTRLAGKTTSNETSLCLSLERPTMACLACGPLYF